MIIQDFDTKKVTLEDLYRSDEYETMTLYFIDPKEWLSAIYDDIVHTEISVEYPLNCPEAFAATVMVSPTRDIGHGKYEDYDWNDLDLALSDLEILLDIAETATTHDL